LAILAQAARSVSPMAVVQQELSMLAAQFALARSGSLTLVARSRLPD